MYRLGEHYNSVQPITEGDLENGDQENKEIISGQQQTGLEA